MSSKKTLDQLPELALVKIFSFLSPKDLFENVASVSKRMKSIADDNWNWNNRLKTDFPHYKEFYQKRNAKASYHHIRNVLNKVFRKDHFGNSSTPWLSCSVDNNLNFHALSPLPILSHDDHLNRFMKECHLSKSDFIKMIFHSLALLTKPQILMLLSNDTAINLMTSDALYGFLIAHNSEDLNRLFLDDASVLRRKLTLEQLSGLDILQTKNLGSEISSTAELMACFAICKNTTEVKKLFLQHQNIVENLRTDEWHILMSINEDTAMLILHLEYASKTEIFAGASYRLTALALSSRKLSWHILNSKLVELLTSSDLVHLAWANTQDGFLILQKHTRRLSNVNLLWIAEINVEHGLYILNSALAKELDSDIMHILFHKKVEYAWKILKTQRLTQTIEGHHIASFAENHLNYANYILQSDLSEHLDEWDFYRTAKKFPELANEILNTEKFSKKLGEDAKEKIQEIFNQFEEQSLRPQLACK